MDYNVLFDQLGGYRRFVAMTGAGRFTYNSADQSLTFKIPMTKGKNKINIVKISLAPDDTYTMIFSRFQNYKMTEVARHEGVYCDGLIQVFEMVTGLSLGEIQ